MGYTTDFTGKVKVEPALNADEISFLNDFNNTRHMHRVRGPLFAPADLGAGKDLDVIDGNSPDPSQPGLWCQWVPSSDGKSISWDENEKFYCSAEWMTYLIDNLLSETGRAYVEKHHSGDTRLDNFTFNHVVNGVIKAQGEDPQDRWNLIAKSNAVTVKTLSK